MNVLNVERLTDRSVFAEQTILRCFDIHVFLTISIAVAQSPNLPTLQEEDVQGDRDGYAGDVEEDYGVETVQQEPDVEEAMANKEAEVAGDPYNPDPLDLAANADRDRMAEDAKAADDLLGEMLDDVPCTGLAGCVCEKCLNFYREMGINSRYVNNELICYY